MQKKKKVKAGYLLKGYFVIPIVFAALILAFGIFLLAAGNMFSGLVVLILFAAFTLTFLIFLAVNHQKIENRLIRFARDFRVMEGRFIENLPFPYVVVEPDGNILLYNKKFGEFYSEDSEVTNICSIFRELKPADLNFDGKEAAFSVIFNSRNYRLHFNTLVLPENIVPEGLVSTRKEPDIYLYAIHIIDETETVNLIRTLTAEQAVLGSLYVDNYNEAIEQVKSTSRLLAPALIDQEVINYFTGYGGVVRKLEKDRYFVMFKRSSLPSMQRTRFDLLDKIRGIDYGSDMPVTISLGLGAGRDYQESQEFSRVALELALGRGGDQVVIKDEGRTYFYGGKTKAAEKNTRVRARVMATSLREIIQGKERVVIMGHKTGDMDCIGSSIGMYKAARALNVPAYIVLNELNNVVQPVLELFLDDPEYGENAFIPVENASRYVDDNTALIIVDVNNPNMFELRELTTLTKTIVIVDHHLQTGDNVNNVVLSYIEPTASSASEMVSEILQYIAGDIKLKKTEAEALYAGILLDTNYFSKNTGVRTFEAAAYLRKFGVDVARVKAMFNDSLDEFKAKAEAIKTTEVIEEGFVVAVCPAGNMESPTIIAAQVANELLEVNGVKASFVLLDHAGKIFISARSTGETNVQLIMEKLGGGGHMNSAGAQLPDDTIPSVERKLRLTVKKMLEERII